MTDHAPVSPPTTLLLAEAAGDGFGWGPSGVVWAGFGWLVLVLVAAILLRRRASRRR